MLNRIIIIFLILLSSIIIGCVEKPIDTIRMNYPELPFNTISVNNSEYYIISIDELDKFENVEINIDGLKIEINKLNNSRKNLAMLIKNYPIFKYYRILKYLDDENVVNVNLYLKVNDFSSGCIVISGEPDKIIENNINNEMENIGVRVDVVSINEKLFIYNSKSVRNDIITIT